MDFIDCKRCGGILDKLGNGTTAKCRHCGTVQTIPRQPDEKIADLYKRADHLRRNSEYERAIDIYESILNETPTDAEAHWLIILCRYGVVYVEDSMTQKRFPTVTRIQNTSLLADEDYKAALRYADGEQKAIYRTEAAEIERIRMDFLTISREEEPYDVFICYKDKDEKGHPTEDRAIGMEIYNRLHREGHKVFFAYVSLDDKLGHQYEPYIFAALHSAKVMIVLGTCAAYFTAPWLKNEWSRFITLIKSGHKKTVIAAYKNMEGSELPDELKLQAQDMSKMGFLENLIYVTNREIERNDDSPGKKSHGEKREQEREEYRKEQGRQNRAEGNSSRNIESSPSVSNAPKKKHRGCGIGCFVLLLVFFLAIGSVLVYSWSTVTDLLKEYGLWDRISGILNDVGVLDEFLPTDESENIQDTVVYPGGDSSEDPNGGSSNHIGSIENPFTENGFTYEILADGVKLVGYDGHPEELEIPREVNGYEVVSIGATALNAKAAMRSLT